MIFTLAAFTALAATVSAQSVTQLVGQIPSCALPCFISTVPKVCPGGVTDYGCQCANVQKITPLITPCVLKSCTDTQDQLDTQRISREICTAYSSSQGGSGGQSSTTAASSTTSDMGGAMGTSAGGMTMTGSTAASVTSAAAGAASSAAGGSSSVASGRFAPDGVVLAMIVGFGIAALGMVGFVL